jgi:excisionase family DNA binding protein
MTDAAGPKLFSIERLAERWDLSKWSVRRLIVHGELKSVTIGARRLVPLSEVERAEQFGVGRPRTMNPKK